MDVNVSEKGLEEGAPDVSEQHVHVWSPPPIRRKSLRRRTKGREPKQRPSEERPAEDCLKGTSTSNPYETYANSFRPGKGRKASDRCPETIDILTKLP